MPRAWRNQRPWNRPNQTVRPAFTLNSTPRIAKRRLRLVSEDWTRPKQKKMRNEPILHNCCNLCADLKDARIDAGFRNAGSCANPEHEQAPQTAPAPYRLPRYAEKSPQPGADSTTPFLQFRAKKSVECTSRPRVNRSHDENTTRQRRDATGNARPGHVLRRRVLRGRTIDGHLLPALMSGEETARKKHGVLRHGPRLLAGRLPPL